MKNRFAGRALALVAILIAAPVHAADLELGSQDVPMCSQTQFNEWRKAVAQSFGITAISDPGGHWIADTRVEKQVGELYQPIFVPYGLVKQTLCGIVSRYELYDAPGEHAGWKVTFIPDRDFAHLLSLPRRGGAGEIHDCACESLIENCGDGADNCLTAEVTPDRAFLANPWFPRHGSSPLAGRKLCTYGPWVADHSHRRRPEIHPAEVFWWRDGGEDGDFELFNVLLIQDDSDRFDRPARGGWRYFSEPDSDREPWSKVPRKHRLRFAFEYVPGSPTSKLDIYQPPDGRRFVVTADHPDLAADADDGRHHALVIDGAVAVEAEEMSPSDDILGVTFDVCKNYGGSRFQGWVQIRSALGADDDGGEGYLALTIVEHPAGTASREPSFPTAPDDDDLVMEIVDGTPSFAAATWGAELQGRMSFEIVPGRDRTGRDRTGRDRTGRDRTGRDRTGRDRTGRDRTGRDGSRSNRKTAAALRVTDAHLVEADGERHPLDFEMTGDRQKIQGFISQLPMISPATVELTVASGSVLRASLPGHGISARLTAAAIYDQPARPRVWRTMARMIPSRDETPPLEVVGTKSVRLTLATKWAPLDDGEVQPEESTPVAAALARALEAGGDEAARWFGTETPVSVTWTYEARDLSASRFVALDESGSPSPGAIAVERAETRAKPGWGMRFTFPEGSERRLIEIIATATVTDAFGNHSTAEKKVWNHALRARPEHADALLEALAEQREVSSRLVSDSTFDVDAEQISGSLEVRRVAARQARLRFLEATDDERIDVDELRDLLGLVDAYGELMLVRSRF